MLLLSTNDSWYLDSPAVYQHNGHAVLRAIEGGRYVIRAANTGISSVISDRGEIISSLAPLKQGYVIAEAETLEHRTLYSYVGNLIVLLSALWLVSVTAINIYLKKRKA